MVKIILRTARAILLMNILGALILLVSCASSLPSQKIASGISGKVLIGPVSPVETEGMINNKLFPDAVIFIMDSSGKRKITEIKSDKDGLFIAHLVSGTYLIVPQTPENQILPVSEPQKVVVMENRFTEITVYYDSGIR
jgi:hypothetical protein